MNKRKLSKIFSALIILAIIVTACLYPQWYVTQFKKVGGMYLVWQGDRALRKYKFQKAIDYYNRGLVLFPGHYTAWFNLGNIYILYEDYYSAVDAYENAIKYNPHYITARMNYGVVSAEQLGDFDGAIDQYKTILDVRKKWLVYIPFVFNNIKSYKTNMGLAYYNMGVAYRQKSIYQDPSKRYQMENLSKAIGAYQEAIKILPDHYDSHYNLGLAYHLFGDYNNAGLYYCKAVKISPMSYEAHYNLALLLKFLKYYKESIVEMQKATLLLTEAEGATNRQKYVFDVLNDISRRYMETKDVLYPVVENTSNEEEKDGKKIEETAPSELMEGSVAYVGGNLVLNDDFDKAMMKNFGTCAAEKYFSEDVQYENEKYIHR